MERFGAMETLVAQIQRPEGLTTRVLNGLREAIVSGAMKPGTIYSVPMLAKQFEVSASPVREALVTLASEGVVTVVPNKGFQVVEISETEMDEIFTIRLHLEVCGTTRLAHMNLSADYARIDSLVRATEDAAASGDVSSFLSTDRDFHLNLLTLSGWSRLVDIVSRLRTQTRLYGFNELSDTGMLLEAAREHRRIVDAIRAHDPDLVENLVRQHLSHIRTEWAGIV